MSNVIASIKQRVVSISHLAWAFTFLWGISSIALGVGLVGNNTPSQIFGAVLGTIYILILVWWFFISQPSAIDLPVSEPMGKFVPKYWSMLGVIIILTAILTALTCILFGDGWLMLYLSIPFSLSILIIWCRRLKRKLVVASVFTVIVLAIVEQLLGDEQSSGLIIPISAALMFLAGALMLERTKLTHIRFVDRNYLEAAKSFLWGCVLAVPPALLNLLTLRSAPTSEFDRLFDRWWEAFYAFQPGILEEIWARLLLTTFLYALLRSTSNERPQRALIGAMVIAAFIHGAAHYPSSISNPLEGIFITLMYGIPLVLLYVKRDLERAIGYHFFIDFIRFSAFVIWNTSV